MAMANCRECGRLFQRTRERVCPKCIAAEEEAFELVRAYMREHRVRLVVELAEETGVANTKILKWIREGKLDFQAPDVSEEEGCKRCGRPTDGGELCEACRKDLAQGIAQQRAAMQASARPPEGKVVRWHSRSE